MKLARNNKLEKVLSNDRSINYFFGMPARLSNDVKTLINMIAILLHSVPISRFVLGADARRAVR